MTFLLSAGDISAARAPRELAPPWNSSEEPAPAPGTLQTDGKGGRGYPREASSAALIYSPGAGPANMPQSYLMKIEIKYTKLN